MDHPIEVRRPGIWLAVAAVAAAAAAVWLLPRAVPTLALEQHLSRQVALQRADSFFQAHDLAPDGARTAVRFWGDDSLQTYLDLEGGIDTVNAALRGTDVALYTWNVRAFVPRDPHEARVSFASDGRVVGFRRILAEADPRPDVGDEQGLALARTVLTSWLGLDPGPWRLATSSYETRQASGRVDRTYTFERTDRRMLEAPIRLDIMVAGDLPSLARPYVVVPESFQRRYDEMRSANDFIAMVAQLGLLVLLILGAIFLRRWAVMGEVRWGPALGVGGVIGVLAFGAQLNQLPGGWYSYDTATSPGVFQAMNFIQALLGGVGLALLVGLTVAVAEAAARHAFPRHLDWWKAWKHRGTRQVAGRVASGYVVALIGFAYVGLFYLVTRTGLGWWVPSELMDDPNLISTPMPWLSGVALALQAGVWEESLFRALPLSLLALWARNRPHRMRWLAAGVVGTALVFGFAHANYPSWPPYSRGVEIFLDACFWAVLFLWLGFLVTVIAHFAYDLVLFGLFAASGSGAEYRITAVITLLALLTPALAVAWRWARQRRLHTLPDEGRFGAWTPPPKVEAAAPPAPTRSHALTPAARTVAITVGGVALLLAVLLPAAPHRGPLFTAGKDAVVESADSMARAHGVEPDRWRRLMGTGSDSLGGGWSRFLVQEHAEDMADTLARTYNPAAWWLVRYVHIGGTAADRAEEWNVRVWPDGRPLDVLHLVPDSARGDTLSADEARAAAQRAMAAAGVDTDVLRESDLRATERPARRDVTLIYTDTTVHLPGDAAAQVRVALAGSEPLAVRRAIELPEAFRRADRERQSTRVIVVLVWSILFSAVASVAVVLSIRGRPALLHDDLLDRRRSLMVVGALTLVGVAAALDSFPTRLFAYSTAVPWSNWVGVNVVVSLLAVVPALAVLGLWMAVAALRRRVGVPLVPRGEDGIRDVLLAGLGLGALLTLVRLGMSLAERGGIPSPPSTGLAEAVPLLGPALSMPLQVAFTVTLLAIPALAVVGVSSRAPVRWMVALLMVVAPVGVAVSLSPTETPLLRGAALTVTLLAAAWMAARLWAPLCAWSWVLAGLFDVVFLATRTAVHAPTGIERGGGMVALLAAAGLLALAIRAVPGLPVRPKETSP